MTLVCYATESQCQKECQPPIPVPEIMNLIFAYQPVEIKTGFDVKDDDPDKVIAQKTKEELNAQLQHSQTLTRLLLEYTTMIDTYRMNKGNYVEVLTKLPTW